MLASLKRRAKQEVLWQVRSQLPSLSPAMMQFGQFWPHAHESSAYTLPAFTSPQERHPASTLAVPPRDLWAGYGTTTEGYLASGLEDIQTLRSILATHGAPVERAGRVLEMGCAAGRLIRWLIDLSPQTELWGTDIWATAIYWCQEHLAPAHFATITTVPHMPFEDRSFDVIYCGSVFTHIDDMATAWLLELRRLLRPGGHLYITINDRSAVKRFDGKGNAGDFPRFHERTGGKANWDGFVQRITATPEYDAFKRGSRDMVTIGRSIEAHVLWDADAFCARVSPWLRRLDVVPESYGHQTGVLLQRS